MAKDNQARDLRTRLFWKNFRRHMRLPALMVGLCLLGTVLAFPYLLLDARASNLVGKSLSLSRERERLLQANNELLYSIAQCQSLDRIEQRAAELGLQPSTQVQILPVDYGPLAETPTGQAPWAQDPLPEVSDGLSNGWSRFTGWWQDRWSDVRAWFTPVQAQTSN